MVSQSPVYLSVLVCGAREWSDAAMVQAHLDRLLLSADKVLVVAGGARGADRAAQQWAKSQDPAKVKLEVHPADWKGEGKKAGMSRNQRMLDRLDELAKRGCKVRVLAFKDGFGSSPSGTENMVAIAKTAKVRGKIISHAA